MVEEKGKELEKKRKELLEVYQQWYEQLTELLEKCPVFRDRQYSHPYYLHIPDDWYQSTYRILIVGEEGRGEKPFDRPIEEAQEFNRTYLLRQLGKSSQYDRQYEWNNSPFWRRIRSIDELMKGKDHSITWTNLDMIHHNGTKDCALTAKERKALHDTDIKILSKEIDILQPTHVIYFGWYFISVRAELHNDHSDVFKHLYTSEKRRDNSQWGKEKMTKYPEYQKNGNVIWHIFTYHPGWVNRQKQAFKEEYEKKVLDQISDTLTQG